MPNEYNDDTFIHPIAQIFPPLDGAAFEQLVRDVEANGVREPIVRHRDGRVIDGRNRLLASKAAGVECPSRVFDGDDDELLAFVISANVNRRHLRLSQRAMIAAKLATVPQGGDRRSASFKTQICGMKIEEAAALFGVSERLVESAKAVHRDGVPELIEAVEKGLMTVSAAVLVAKKAPERQRRIVSSASCDAELGLLDAESAALDKVQETTPEPPPPGVLDLELQERASIPSPLPAGEPEESETDAMEEDREIDSEAPSAEVGRSLEPWANLSPPENSKDVSVEPNKPTSRGREQPAPRRRADRADDIHCEDLTPPFLTEEQFNLHHVVTFLSTMLPPLSPQQAFRATPDDRHAELTQRAGQLHRWLGEYLRLLNGEAG